MGHCDDWKQLMDHREATEIDSAGIGGLYQLDSHFTWIVGNIDPTTTVTTAWEVRHVIMHLICHILIIIIMIYNYELQKYFSRTHQRVVFPGDHFFIFKQDDIDRDIAQAALQAIFRCENI